MRINVLICSRVVTSDVLFHRKFKAFDFGLLKILVMDAKTGENLMFLFLVTLLIFIISSEIRISDCYLAIRLE